VTLNSATAYQVVGVVHLPALPGSPRGGSTRDLQAIEDRVRRDAAAYARAGVDALILENFGDVPFGAGRVDAHVVAIMTRLALAVHGETGLPHGINVLRNDVLSAVSIAAGSDGSFVRANVYVGAALTDQGIIQGQAEAVQALIRRLGAEIDIWADVDVKHAVQLTPRPLADLASDAIERGLATAVIVSGRATGQPTSTADLTAVRAAVTGAPLYVGSGATAENAASLLQYADGLIVGTAAKVDGIVSNSVDIGRTGAIVAAVRDRKIG
jgi:membrane complex biogenesis BtpA family protein